MSGLKRLLLSRRFVATATSSRHTQKGPPIVVNQTANAGRGVFATRDIAQGELIHSADPLVVHPKLDRISEVCYFCLKAIDRFDGMAKVHEVQPHGHRGKTAAPISPGEGEGEACSFCSAACAVRAKSFSVIECRGDWSELEEYCRESGLKFPLVAKRLACMVATGAASPHALDILSYPLLPSDGPPHQWKDERALLLKSLKSAGVVPAKLGFLSEEWYAGVISRLHINSFAIEIISPSFSADLLEAAASSVSGEGSVGTAVYTLPSMYNHDCDPNVSVSWPVNATMELEARQPISAGDELRITYVDASMAYNARQELLREAYGFVCDCPRCEHRE